MKCDELKPIELECNMGKDVNGVEHREPWKAYDIDEVDALLAKKDAEIAELKQKLEDVNKAIAEKDNEIFNLKYSRDEWAKACNQKDKENAELNAKLETVNELVKTARQMLEDAKATAYAESVDAGMRECRLTRALWIHRAIVAKLNKEGCKEMRAYNPFIGIQEYQWERVEAKCRAKAEKFK